MKQPKACFSMGWDESGYHPMILINIGKSKNKQYVQILNQKLYKTSNEKYSIEKYNKTMKSG
ncbi:hypothetical protein SRABI96_00705 [Peribacillus sp. Bi96]|nr:hypothetical protein SRABI96_00705 [Peribacillus sp. Bi96]